MFVLSFWTLCSFWAPLASLYFYFFCCFSQQGSHIYQKRTFRGTERDVVQHTAPLSLSLSHSHSLSVALSLSSSHSTCLTRPLSLLLTCHTFLRFLPAPLMSVQQSYYSLSNTLPTILSEPFYFFLFPSLFLSFTTSFFFWTYLSQRLSVLGTTSTKRARYPITKPHTETYQNEWEILAYKACN